MGSLSSAALLVPLLGGLLFASRRGSGFWSILGGTVGTLGWAGLQWVFEGAGAVEPLFVGLFMSFVLFVVGARPR